LIGTTQALVLAHAGQREARARAAELLREALTIARRCELHAISQLCVELARQHDLELADRGPARQPARS
jgi:hypothetical protein